jgi:hypothetical protein
MPYLRTRVEVAARLRRDGQFPGSLPSTADVNADLNETLAWWWSVLARDERAGIGSIVSTVSTVALQSFVALPAAQRHLREVYREQFPDVPALATTRLAYGQPTTEPPLPGVWWPEYRAAQGQVIELRPIPTAIEVVTLIGTSVPPSWANDATTVDLIDEVHERAIVDVTRARIHFRDDGAKLAAAQQAAARSLVDAMGYHVPQTPTPWTMWQRSW